MEQNEQLSENITKEQVENGGNNYDPTAEQPAETEVEESNDSTTEKENSAITDPQATIKIEGQEFELEAALADDDKLLKTILQPHFASVENANITRDVKEGKVIVTIVKKAPHKGGKQPEC